jgi:DNA-binding XRE family transcriptional regulator
LIVELLRRGDVAQAQQVFAAKDKIKELREEHRDWTQSQIAQMVGVSKQYVHKVESTKMSESKKVVVPANLKSRTDRADFRKLPLELQAKVASKEMSLNAAAIQAGIRRKLAPEDAVLKAFRKAENRMDFLWLILQTLSESDKAALRQWIEEKESKQ